MDKVVTQEAVWLSGYSAARRSGGTTISWEVPVRLPCIFSPLSHQGTRNWTSALCMELSALPLSCAQPPNRLWLSVYTPHLSKLPEWTLLLSILEEQPGKLGKFPGQHLQGEQVSASWSPPLTSANINPRAATVKSEDIGSSVMEKHLSIN